MINEKKICFISCVNDEAQYEECLKYINSLNVPNGFNIETISVRNADSIAEAYNSAMRESDAKYKVYLHQDVFIINKNFILDIINLFKSNENIGMVGVAGAKTLPKSAIWWESPYICGKVYGSLREKMECYVYSNFNEKFENVSVIDGLIMITQYDINWRDDLFKGWHFYDVSQSIEFILAGYKVVIINQSRPWCIHDCGISNISNGFDDNRKIFLREYSNKIRVINNNMIIEDICKELCKIDNDEINKQEIKLLIENLNDTILNKIISYIDKNINNKIQVLNFIVVKLFENKKYDLIIPLLQKCLEYNKSDYDTLMNLSIALEIVGKRKLALKYAEMIEEKTDEVIDLINDIKSKIKKDSVYGTEQNDVTFTGERLVINREVKDKYNDILEEHLERYKLATNYVRNKLVLDAACGAGYGSKMLASSGAKFVTSVDISSECLLNAKKTYCDKKIDFVQGDVTRLPFENESFDVIISFETIEHIKNGSEWIKESARLLKKDGIFIVSTPNRSVTNPGTFFEERPLNVYHQYEYNTEEFIGELLKKYDLLSIYGQTFVNAKDTYYTQTMRKLRKLDENKKVSNLNVEGHKLIPLSEIKDASPMYLVAICRKKSNEN